MTSENEVIASRDNRWVRRLRRALDLHQEEIVLEGPKQVRDAIRLGWTPLAVAVTEEGPQVEAPGAHSLRLTSKVMKNLTDTVHSQRVLGLFRRPSSEVASLFRAGNLLVALDGVQDPGNVGTVVRLAAAFEIAGVIVLPGTADPYAPKAIRASAGTILQTPVAAVSREELIERTAESGFEIVAAEGGADGRFEPPESNAVFVFGSEGRGISVEIRDHARPLSIPISSRVESLNVAAAAAIILFEARKR
ncbi:MAG: RNA methyltransferase [Thermoanaerobaculia bacterium]